MIPGQSEQGKRRLKLVLALVAVVLVGVILLGITLAGNSSSSEYDDETIQGEAREEYDVETIQGEVQLEQQRLNEQQLKVELKQQNRNNLANVTSIVGLADFISGTMPLFVLLAVLGIILGMFVRIGNDFRKWM